VIKMLALAAAIAAVPVVMAPPAAAYDPCARATRDYRAAEKAYTDYCGLVEGMGPYDNSGCARNGPRRERLFDAYQQARFVMARACRN